MKENPYEPSQLDDSKPESSRKKFFSKPLLVATAIALAMLAGAILWNSSDRWISVFFAAPVVAILIAASQFGSIAVWKSLTSVIALVAVSVAGYIAFFTTCCAVNLSSIGWDYHIGWDPKAAGVVTTITTLLGCFVAFLLSKWLHRTDKK